MYLTRFIINHSRIALGWVSNSYRVHQRLCLVFPHEDRMLFRIEPGENESVILVQSNTLPDWKSGFKNFEVLASEPEVKTFDPVFKAGAQYRFRLLANPTVTRQGKRLGLLTEELQMEWITRQVTKIGAVLQGCLITSNGLQHSSKNPQKDAATQTHVSVRFDGVIQVQDPAVLHAALRNGIGPAKGYGFGLLSLALFSGR